MNIQKNLKFLRQRNKITQEALSLAVNMKRPTLSGYENGVAEPNIEALTALSKYYHISVDTLIKIDLTQLSEPQLIELERGNDIFLKGANLRVLATTVDSTNNENIELVPEKAKAGYATGFADPDYIKELPVFTLPFLSKSRKYRTFQLKGDSMLPIPDGSWVTGEYVQDLSSIETGQGYIIFTIDDGIVFKIAENQIETNGRLVLYSLNPLYEPYEVSTSEIKEVWKFVNYISAEIPDPMVPSDSLLKTVAGLKRDMLWMKRRMGKN